MDFLIKIILFTLKIYFFYSERCPKFCKNQFFSNIFPFLSVILQYLEYTLKLLANFRIKTQKSTDSANTFSKKLQFWGDFLIKIILFTLTIYCISYNERRPKYRKNPDFSNIFTFPSVMHRIYEYNLRIFSNFRVKTQKSKDFAYTFSKNYIFFFFLIKMVLFTLKIYFLQRKMPKFL